MAEAKWTLLGSPGDVAWARSDPSGNPVTAVIDGDHRAQNVIIKGG
jgi:hypothetical protein